VHVEQCIAHCTAISCSRMSELAVMKVRVLLVGPSLDILGGQAIQAQRLFRNLQENPRLDVEFLAVNPRLSGFFAWCQRIKYVRTVVTSSAYIVSLLRRIRHADVVHAFSASYTSYLLAPLPAMVVARLMGKATVLNYRSGEAADHLSRWKWTAVPTMQRLADAIVVPSQYLVDVFGKYRLTATAIHNFVPLDRLPYRRRVNIAPRFLSNRNLEPLYNVECSIRAFAEVRKSVPEALLTIAGDGSQRARLTTLVGDLGLGESVRFVGKVTNQSMDALYDASDIYLNSPNIDNMPGSILEAFATGIFVLTTDAGGIPFIVQDGVNGRMVKVGDHQELAAAALDVINDPVSALARADSARAECERLYSWSTVGSSWEDLYLGLRPRTGSTRVA
jgi:glycosyltransferase involved in cell wall biosynthesis